MQEMNAGVIVCRQPGRIADCRVRGRKEIHGKISDPLRKRLSTGGMVLLRVVGIGGFPGSWLLGFAQLPQFVKVGSPEPNAQEQNAALSVGRRGLDTKCSSHPRVPQP